MIIFYKQERQTVYSRYLINALFYLLVFFVGSCGIVGSSSWVAFTDSLNRGSKVEPSKVLVNLRGEVDVRMTKPADPDWVPGKQLEYPYAGIMMMFHQSGEVVDLSGSSGISLEYRSEGTISLLLAQNAISPGGEYRITLPSQDKFTVNFFPWHQFQQPTWVDNPVPMDLQRITGVMFTNSSSEQSTANLIIRHVSFPLSKNRATRQP